MKIWILLGYFSLKFFEFFLECYWVGAFLLYLQKLMSVSGVMISHGGVLNKVVL